MLFRGSIAMIALATALFTPVSATRAFDDATYLDLSGQWLAVRLGVGGQPGSIRPSPGGSANRRR